MGNIRFQRLFNRNERAVIVAMDHCLFEGPVEGMTNLAETASRVAPCVDGVLLSPGMLPYCQHAFNYKGAPLAVVFGRNALQIPDPLAFQQALCDVVKRGMSPAEAVHKYHLE
jgi:DhnA family fructose-bisphosphate aldolase class Ia